MSTVHNVEEKALCTEDSVEAYVANRSECTSGAVRALKIQRYWKTQRQRAEQKYRHNTGRTTDGPKFHSPDDDHLLMD